MTREPSDPDGAIPLLTVELRYERDVVLARQRARQIAELLGFDTQDQTRIATAVSELARNAHEYAGGGRVAFGLDPDGDLPQCLRVRVSDAGPGIADLPAVLEGRYVSPTGMGLGILGARRLSEVFDIRSARGSGTVVTIARSLPPEAAPVTIAHAQRVCDALASADAEGPFEEIQRQNQEVLAALEEIRVRQAEVERLNAELAETNRGVLALYSELDDRARDLERASHDKSRFLSDMSHELRTPLTSVLNLSRILLARSDGELTPEQERQVQLIRQSMETLADMVNDLLDTAKIEAGRVTLTLTRFTLADLFAEVRAICRPLFTGNRVSLVMEEVPGGIALHTDQRRVEQVLRNFISNAVKFTEWGEVRVGAAVASDGMLRLSVRDTGIGIAPADRERIFGDFTQVDGPIQRRVRGTGLGLPLTRKLAAMLGGRVELESVLGVGSTFALVLPPVHPDTMGDAEHGRGTADTSREIAGAGVQS